MQERLSFLERYTSKYCVAFENLSLNSNESSLNDNVRIFFDKIPKSLIE